ncbi:winged helix-turn-helix domain-containing protein [Pseudarthrobacter sulfonivorans]|uniref:winged helix-turn-helix transcriptional regulator n=1 Tax=Pseudarthrobacter sulfonivorans TaxID=121292 RepID=UPI002858BE71|nr:winged helix-turn-helix domain-containing protein [Pseudarthrobacter sulfonivorans]MDR6415222.1 DNA-binding response OmpR family regulator [Pseudarthrobacter sulfonivorans]
MAVNAHAPRPQLRPRGLAVWLQPCEGQDIDPAVWTQAANAVLARARQLAPEAEVQLWPDADNWMSGVEGAGAEGSDAEGSGGGRADAVGSDAEGSGAVSPPVSLAGRRSTVAVDLAQDTVLLDGIPVSFTRMEYSLLRYLVENLSRPVQREELQGFLESLECPGAAFRSIDVYVGRIRRKLGSARHAVATVRGGGYQFVPGPGSTVRGPAEYCI